MKKPINKGNDYLLRLSNNDELIYWPKDTTQQYLSKPSRLMPSSLVKTTDNGKITQPQKLPYDILERAGIIAAAFSRKSSKAHHYLSKAPYSIIVFALNGIIGFRSGENKFQLKRGESLIIPKGGMGHLAIRSPFSDMFWLHINGKSPLNPHIGKDVCVKKFDSYEEIIKILEIYKKEIYFKKRSILVLENLVNTLSILLTRDLCGQPEKLDESTVEKLMREMGKNPSKNFTRPMVAKRFKISADELDKIFLRHCGNKFSKVVLSIRMKEAFKLLKGGLRDCSEIASIIGYGSVFSFSRAFKAYYGKSPTKLNAQNFT